MTMNARPLEAPAAFWDFVPSPLGKLTIAVDAAARLVEIRLREAPPAGRRDPLRCAAIAQQLEQYFAGDRRTFDLEVRPRGSSFQQRVWLALRKIPWGDVCNYGDIARRIGQPGAARAVGQANGANPIPIVIPCHRVIASDGTIGGYSGGLGIKERLLALEGRWPLLP
jgi:methylated-DNA-[protein]-cysteine S-methyltransferase